MLARVCPPQASAGLRDTYPIETEVVTLRKRGAASQAASDMCELRHVGRWQQAWYLLHPGMLEDVPDDSAG